jgi:pimeloyl-ACP methyl ester carboxylesterase
MVARGACSAVKCWSKQACALPVSSSSPQVKSKLSGYQAQPKLIMHGDDDQIVPIANSAFLSAKIINNAILKVYPGLPHGMCQTHKDLINADLLEFIQQTQQGTTKAA